MKDKQLVMCWDDGVSMGRYLGFYCYAKDAVYSHDGFNKWRHNIPIDLDAMPEPLRNDLIGILERLENAKI